MTILYSKYKDADPQQTVKTIKEHYASLQLNMEYSVEKHIDGVYSAYLYDVDGRWNTAGKGTTEAFCLASAYGESMEHLCNHFAFDISKTSERAKAYGGFCRYYDEIQLPVEAIEEVSPIVFRDMRSCCGTSNTNNTEVIEIWKKSFNAIRLRLFHILMYHREKPNYFQMRFCQNYVVPTVVVVAIRRRRPSGMRWMRLLNGMLNTKLCLTI